MVNINQTSVKINYLNFANPCHLFLLLSIGHFNKSCNIFQKAYQCCNFQKHIMRNSFYCNMNILQKNQTFSNTYITVNIRKITHIQECGREGNKRIDLMLYTGEKKN